MGDGCEPCEPDDGQPDQALDEQWRGPPDCDHDFTGATILIAGQEYATCVHCGAVEDWW